MNPRLTLEILFRLKLGYPLNLDDPRTYNEKLQWIKLYDRNPLMPRCCDKYAVRSYVEERGCAQYLNRLIWEGFDPADIPFDELPERFVVKVTHGSTFNIICTDRDSLDRDYAVRKLRKWLKTDFLPCYGEWFYGERAGVAPRVIVEQYLDTGESSLDDYKVFAFEGKPECILLCTGRGTAAGHYEDVFDTNWKRLPGVAMGYPNAPSLPDRPDCLGELLEAASALSKPFHHARVDFYVVEGRPVFGELTFTSGSGFDRITPRSFDEHLGSLMSLPIGEASHG